MDRFEQRSRVWFGTLGILFLMAWDSNAIAASGSPLDAYYKQQAAGEVQAPLVPTDNDQYYVAPGQYIHHYGEQHPNASSSTKSNSCNSIGDSPSCISD